MFSHRITYRQIKLTVYGKNKQGKKRQKTFFETMNPWNKNKKGIPKSVDEIYESLKLKGEKWKKEIAKSND